MRPEATPPSHPSAASTILSEPPKLNASAYVVGRTTVTAGNFKHGPTRVILETINTVLVPYAVNLYQPVQLLNSGIAGNVRCDIGITDTVVTDHGRLVYPHRTPAARRVRPAMSGTDFCSPFKRTHS